MSEKSSTLWLIPNALHNGYEFLPQDYYAFNLPLQVQYIATNLSYWLVENAKTARSFLASLKLPLSVPIQQHMMCVIGDKEQEKFLKKAKLEKIDVGLLSEAGLPAIADPGSEIVNLAHKIGINVVPLVGPCAITLALMSSGLNGQSFAFHGYLPVQENERKKAILNLEKHSFNFKQTQICIETPYRNGAFLQTLVATLNLNTRICVACELTLPTQYIKSLSVSEWKNRTILEEAISKIHKKPCIFLWLA
jgi:16S rRNA (cytidine1402-2'-O)-methyltransferase